MKKYLFAAALSLGAVAGASASTNVGVSIGINQPGVYGRIDIGNAPQPMLVYPQPVVIAPPPRPIPRQPIYLYVPPAHQQHWSQYCGRYSACGQPVYFVQERWVRDRYERAHPGYRYDDRRDWDNGRRGPPPGHVKHDKHDKHDKHGRDDRHDHRDRDDYRR
ncbi:hypothetical protein [Variovorax sp. HJSM1_2]|uniref:hypothetical protein n=1 Tax=Variovorax sp. HJSM1_2 TaxID=3366263 RepID=UPI003BD1B1D5